jgi:hypothetical protein
VSEISKLYIGLIIVTVILAIV